MNRHKKTYRLTDRGELVLGVGQLLAMCGAYWLALRLLFG